MKCEVHLIQSSRCCDQFCPYIKLEQESSRRPIDRCYRLDLNCGRTVLEKFCPRTLGLQCGKRELEKLAITEKAGSGTALVY